MKAKTSILAIVLGLASAVATAGSCPMDMKKIDDALTANTKLSAAQVSEVKQHRSDGENLHKAGKHQEAVAEFTKAKTILGI